MGFPPDTAGTCDDWQLVAQTMAWREPPSCPPQLFQLARARQAVHPTLPGPRDNPNAIRKTQEPESAIMPTVADKRLTFRKLHEAGCFVIPNPWNVGTARYFQHLGFKALATTSSGFAHAQGFADGAVPRDMMLAHLREIVEAADVPVNADFEGGYADAPEGVAESVRLCIATGVAGLSIEDSTGDKDKPLYDLDLAVARIKAARAAIDKAGGDVLLTGRAECFLVGRPDLDDTIRRLRAYA